jgi:hypothetical protein
VPFCYFTFENAHLPSVHFRPWKGDRLAGFVWIGRGEKPVPFPCRSHFFPSKTLHKMPSAALYVVEVTFSRGFESYLRSHSFKQLRDSAIQLQSITRVSEAQIPRFCTRHFWTRPDSPLLPVGTRKVF